MEDQPKQPLPINTDQWRAFMAQYQIRQRKKRILNQAKLFITESCVLILTEDGQPLALEN